MSIKKSSKYTHIYRGKRKVCGIISQLIFNGLSPLTEVRRLFEYIFKYLYIYIDTVFQYAFNSSTLLQFLIYLEYFSAAYYCYVNPPRLLYERSRTMWPKSLCGNILFAWKRYTKKMKNSIRHKYWQPQQQLLVMITKTNGSSLTYMQGERRECVKNFK